MSTLVSPNILNWWGVVLGHRCLGLCNRSSSTMWLRSALKEKLTKDPYLHKHVTPKSFQRTASIYCLSQSQTNTHWHIGWIHQLVWRLTYRQFLFWQSHLVSSSHWARLSLPLGQCPLHRVWWKQNKCPKVHANIAKETSLRSLKAASTVIKCRRILLEHHTNYKLMYIYCCSQLSMLWSGYSV